MKNETICAISTPLGSGAINIVRLSGDNALSISEKLFTSKHLNYREITPRKMYLGEFSAGQIKEKCLMVYFKNPASYTGEDMVEFQCHGGELISKKVLEACLENGAVLASPGEFTKRAFLNGKMSLDEAEGVIDIISSESEAELKASYQLIDKKLSNKISELQKRLTNILAEIEVNLDYPEHDDETKSNNKILTELEEIKCDLTGLVEHSNETSQIKDGVNVVLVGKPNVGKSSILNLLLDEDRAIVTDIEGTTRDVLKEKIVYNGVKFNIIDTAGLRESKDVIEQIGIDKTKQEIKDAGIILFVLDNSQEISKEEQDFLESIKDKNYTIIINKSDKNSKISQKFDDFLLINTINKENSKIIKDKIYEKTMGNKIDFSGMVLTNLRHINLIKEAIKKTEKAKLTIGNSLDLLAFDVKQIWDTLGKITGETESDKIIDEIFSRFCLGK